MRSAMNLRVLAVVAAAAGLGAAAVVFHDAQPRRSTELRRATTRPSQWWYEQRSFPSGRIPVAEYEAALEQALVDRAVARLSTSAGLLQWQFVGPDNIGGRITAMAVVPGGTTIYIGAANGGVFKSTNSGSNWTPIFDDFNAYSIGALALDPTDSNILYVGTGESNPAIDTYDGNGVFKTTDGGVSWTHLGPAGVKRIGRIAIDPLDPQRIYVAAGGSYFQTNTHGGIWRSEDGGQTWSHVLYVDPTTVGIDVAIHPAHPESLLCAMWDLGLSPTTGSAIHRSTDYGSTWTQLGPPEGLPAANDSTDRIALAYAPSLPTTIYAQIIAGPGYSSAIYKGRGMYRSTDGGATWRKRDTGGLFQSGFGGFGWYFGSMGVDPLNPQTVYALGVSFMRSIDGGTNWGDFTLPPLHVDQHAIWIDPSNTSKIYLAGDGGFFKSANGGITWTKGLNLPITQFYAIDVDPSNALRPIGGTQDNNTILSAGSPSAWAPIFGGDGFYCIIDPTNPSVIFAEYQNMTGGQGPVRSVNGGASFSAPTGIVSSDRFNWNAPFVMDPGNHNVLLAGSHRVYKSTNNGQSYAPVSADLAYNPSASRPFGTLATLAISPLTPRRYYTGSSNGKVYRSPDGGSTWQDITTGLPLRHITRVVADPFDSSTVYVTLSAFNGSPENAHVYRSADNGDSWTGIEGNLPNAPVNDLIVDPTDPNRLYVGTDLGVYTTQNQGATWYPLGQGLPFQAVFDLELHQATRTLFAGTHGRSMWSLDLTRIPVAVGSQPAVTRLSMSAPSPNPSRGPVRFALDVEQDTPVTIAVFDALGRRVRSIHDGPLPAGRHSFSWDGREASGRASRPGVYFLRADGPGGTQTRRVIRAE